jgi:hypothetical protein
VTSRAKLLADAAFAAMNAGNREAQGRYAQAAIDIGGQATPAIAHVELSTWHLSNGDVELALGSARRAVAAATDLTMQVLAHQQLLMVLGASGNESEIRAGIAVLVDLAERLGSPTLRVASYLTAGQGLALIGSNEEALDMFRAGLTDADLAGARMQADARLWCAFEVHDDNEAAHLLREATPVVREQLTGEARIDALVPVAKYALATAAPVHAAQLIGAYQRHIKEYGGSGQRLPAQWCDRLVDDLAGSLSAEVLDEELRRGAGLSVDAALELALDVVGRDGDPPAI